MTKIHRHGCQKRCCPWNRCLKNHRWMCVYTGEKNKETLVNPEHVKGIFQAELTGAHLAVAQTVEGKMMIERDGQLTRRCCRCCYRNCCYRNCCCQNCCCHCCCHCCHRRDHRRRHRRLCVSRARWGYRWCRAARAGTRRVARRRHRRAGQRQPLRSRR